MCARARVWQLHNHFQFVGPAHRRSLLRACCWLSDGSVGGERGGEFQTEPSSSKRAKRDDSVGSRGTWWTSLLGLDGPNSAYEQLNAAGGEASVFSNFLRIHPRHITTKLYAAHPPPPPTSFSLLPPAFSDGSVCVTVHAQKHAGMLVGFSHCVVLKAQTGSSETFNVGMRVCVRVCYTNHLRLCSRAWHCTLHCFVMFSRRPLTFFFDTRMWRNRDVSERSVRARAFASLELRTWDFLANRALTHFTVIRSRWRHLKDVRSRKCNFVLKQDKFIQKCRVLC